MDFPDPLRPGMKLEDVLAIQGIKHHHQPQVHPSKDIYDVTLPGAPTTFTLYFRSEDERGLVLDRALPSAPPRQRDHYQSPSPVFSSNTR